MAMDTFYKATEGNVASAGLALDEWRPLFNERHTGDNQSSKNTAFARTRKDLVDKGLLECSDDTYRLGDKATQGRHRQCRHMPSFTLGDTTHP